MLHGPGEEWGEDDENRDKTRQSFMLHKQVQGKVNTLFTELKTRNRKRKHEGKIFFHFLFRCFWLWSIAILCDPRDTLTMSEPTTNNITTWFCAASTNFKLKFRLSSAISVLIFNFSSRLHKPIAAKRRRDQLDRNNKNTIAKGCRADKRIQREEGEGVCNAEITTPQVLQ